MCLSLSRTAAPVEGAGALVQLTGVWLIQAEHHRGPYQGTDCGARGSLVACLTVDSCQAAGQDRLGKLEAHINAEIVLNTAAPFIKKAFFAAKRCTT